MVSSDDPVVSGLILRTPDVPKFPIIVGYSSDISINESALQISDYIEDILFLFSSYFPLNKYIGIIYKKILRIRYCL
jgi:hypothetical protein